MPEPVSCSDCALYTHGHCVHPIQARLGWETDPATRTQATVTDLTYDGWITLDADGTTRRYWNHDLAAIRRAVAASGGRAELPGFAQLRLPHDGGCFVLCIDAAHSTPCRGRDTGGNTPEDLARRLLTHGGGLIPGADALSGRRELMSKPVQSDRPEHR